MGYVKTAAEIADIQEQLSGVTYEIDAVEAWFTTSEDFLRAVLPPCFDMPAEPTGLVQIGLAGSVRSQFGSATIYVGARFGDIEGFYDLTMLLTGDMTVTLGRELWGESKKRADVQFRADLPRVHGYAERNGVRVIEVSADLGEDLGPHEEEMTSLHLKGIPNGKVTDLDNDPIVYIGKAYAHYRTYYEGTATIQLQSTLEDPCGTVPILSIDRVVYGVRSADFTMDESRLTGREGYLPYILGRSYDVVRHADRPSLDNIRSVS